MNFNKIFEVHVLRVISITIFILGLSYLYDREWIFGIFILLFDILVFGGIGQSLKHNKQKSMRELLRNQDLDSDDNNKQSLDISPEESVSIARPLLFTSWSLIVLTIIIFFHQGYRFYIAIPLGILIGFVPLLLFGVVILVSRLIIKSMK